MSLSAKDIKKSRYANDVVARLIVDAGIHEDHAEKEMGGSLITARLEREAAEELRILRRQVAYQIAINTRLKNNNSINKYAGRIEAQLKGKQCL